MSQTSRSVHICRKYSSFHKRVQNPPASLALLHFLPFPGRQNSIMGCDPVLMELGKNPDSTISRLGTWEEADTSQAHPAGIASV